MAVRLRQYGIKSKQVRIGEASLKGYEKSDFVDAWERYLPSPPPSDGSETSETNVSDVSDVSHVGDEGGERVCAVCKTGGDLWDYHGRLVHQECADLEASQ